MPSPNERDEAERSYRVEMRESAEAEAEATYLWMSERSPDYALGAPHPPQFPAAPYGREGRAMSANGCEDEGLAAQVLRELGVVLENAYAVVRAMP
jgi:hypothetical protein